MDYPKLDKVNKIHHNKLVSEIRLDELNFWKNELKLLKKKFTIEYIDFLISEKETWIKNIKKEIKEYNVIIKNELNKK